MQTILRRFSRVVKEKKQNYYQVLDVTQDASQKVIKNQFQKLTKIYHPDIYTGQEKERYAQILKAYETLKNPVKRSKYDAEIMKIAKVHKRKETDGRADGETEDGVQGDEARKEKSTIFDDYYNFNPSEAKVREEINRMQHRKVKTDFGKINLHETPLQRQMNDYEKTREKFVEEFNREKTLKDFTQKKQSYNEALKQNIEFVNNVKANEHQANSEPTVKSPWQRRMSTILQISLFTAFGIFAMVTFDQKMYYKKQMEEVKKDFTNQVDEAVYREIRGRFVYN